MLLLTADPKASYQAHADEIRAAIERVLASGRYILGEEVAAFEREFALYLGGGFSVGVANGTEALELALRAVGVSRGQKVATVANTATATVTAIEQIGAEPVFVEIEEDTMLMSPSSLERAFETVQGGIAAVVPVHLYGRPADMPAIAAIARKRGARIVEDCAQAHGARIGSKSVGTFGDLAAFSFYPTKNLAALGDGGAVFTQDAALAEQVKLLRMYGWKTRYVSELRGRNSRLDELQAAILRVKLRYLEGENDRRRALAERYLRLLAPSTLRLPAADKGLRQVWHQFAVRTPGRDALAARLEGENILAGVLYPVPVHRQPAYAQTVSLPLTERACAEVLCLPCHPLLAEADVDRVAEAVLRWAKA